MIGIREQARHLVQRVLPGPVHSLLSQKHEGHEDSPRVGHVDLGSLRRLAPISREFGYDRGQPIDRYYIENFLAQYADDIRGHVLEIEDDAYTRKFGGARVTAIDVLHVSEGNPNATIVADLSCADHIPSDIFDCVILTQTLMYIYNMGEALRTLHRILRPGGVLLATFPGICQADRDWEEVFYWQLTSRSAWRLFSDVFPRENVAIEAHGNVLVAISFLHGLAAGELRPEELDYHDPAYEVLITARALKPGTA
jgi:SAM-dependent methyltransferase